MKQLSEKMCKTRNLMDSIADFQSCSSMRTIQIQERKYLLDNLAIQLLWKQPVCHDKVAYSSLDIDHHNHTNSNNSNQCFYKDHHNNHFQQDGLQDMFHCNLMK